MAHFGSVDWHTPSGLVASLEKDGNVALEATAATSTEGTNMLTYTTVRKGLYRLSAYLRVRVASDAATSHTAAAFASYNNGTAITSATMGQSGLTPGTLSLKGTAGTSVLLQSETVLCASGTNIVMTVSEAVTGAKTAGVGTYDIYFAIEAV